LEFSRLPKQRLTELILVKPSLTRKYVWKGSIVRIYSNDSTSSYIQHSAKYLRTEDKDSPFQIGKLRLSKVMVLTQGQTTNKWQSPDSGYGMPAAPFYCSSVFLPAPSLCGYLGPDSMIKVGFIHTCPEDALEQLAIFRGDVGRGKCLDLSHS
jgi:hypothetical protein